MRSRCCEHGMVDQTEERHAKRLEKASNDELFIQLKAMADLGGPSLPKAKPPLPKPKQPIRQQFVDARLPITFEQVHYAPEPRNYPLRAFSAATMLCQRKRQCPSLLQELSPSNDGPRRSSLRPQMQSLARPRATSLENR